MRNYYLMSGLGMLFVSGIGIILIDYFKPLWLLNNLFGWIPIALILGLSIMGLFTIVAGFEENKSKEEN